MGDKLPHTRPQCRRIPSPILADQAPQKTNLVDNRGWLVPWEWFASWLPTNYEPTTVSRDWPAQSDQHVFWETQQSWETPPQLRRLPCRYLDACFGPAGGGTLHPGRRQMKGGSAVTSPNHASMPKNKPVSSVVVALANETRKCGPTCRRGVLCAPALSFAD